MKRRGAAFEVRGMLPPLKALILPLVPMSYVYWTKKAPPKLGDGVYSKVIEFKDEPQFVADLTKWVGTFVMRSRAAELVANASGLRDIVEHIRTAPTTMQLGPRTWRVYICFDMGQTRDGQWWVTRVGFTVHDSVSQQNHTPSQRLGRRAPHHHPPRGE